MAPVRRALGASLTLGLAVAVGAPAADAATAAERNLAETVERFESLRVDPVSAAVSDLHLTSGHLTLICKSGSARRAG